MGALRESVLQNEEPSFEDPTTKELFGKVTRAELSVGLSQVKASVDALADRQAKDMERLAEKQSTELRFVAVVGAVLGIVVAVVGAVLGIVVAVVGAVLGIVVAVVGAVLGIVGYMQLSENLMKVVYEVEKLGKITTEFGLYKGGANVFLGALVTSIIAYFVTKK